MYEFSLVIHTNCYVRQFPILTALKCIIRVREIEFKSWSNFSRQFRITKCSNASNFTTNKRSISRRTRATGIPNWLVQHICFCCCRWCSPILIIVLIWHSATATTPTRRRPGTSTNEVPEWCVNSDGVVFYCYFFWLRIPINDCQIFGDTFII